ncbi:MAG: hypothetical protein C0592_13005 [Marinilabiliales bacterium]|nr:MAG: hypothetical protein C0592_13005 [Marinilabiliales bacterium]
MKKIAFLAVFLISFFFSEAQSDSLKPKDKSKFFADIHTAFYHDLAGNTTPNTAFSLSTALFGYTRSFSDKVSATIIYDVTRTTNFTYPDTLGISSYFEGSKYTAFLKMAEIKWNIHKNIELSFGQLLNEQYLTYQDKHWKRRYIVTTFQEYYRFGMPADFGARIRFFPFKSLRISLNAFNGEGPFSYQDSESGFLYAANIEYMPTDNIMIKAYADIQEPPSGFREYRSAISGFLGYWNEKYTVGLEYNKVFNNSYELLTDLEGLSFYGVYKFNKKLAAVTRFDFLTEYHGVENEAFVLGGVEYRPVESLGLSVNYRRNTWLNTSQVFVNAGIRF